MADSFTKALVFVHRWLGVVLSLFFTMWFFSGMVMMYVPFPSLSDADRLGFLSDLDTQAIDVGPGAAIDACGVADVTGVRIIAVASRPVYVCSLASEQLRTVYADTAGQPGNLSIQQATAIARSALGADSVLIDDPLEYDQWIVHQKFDAYRPFYKVMLEDDTHYYISAITGEFLQRTSSTERFWNYLGAVVHWIYPTVLRKNWAWWDRTVWWLALVGVLGVSIGIYLGLLHLYKVRRSGRKVLSPFRGWMRLHHLAGLFTGLIVLSWVFSGWLSMDHGRLFSMPGATEEKVRLLQGLPLPEVAARLSIDDLRAYRRVREITLGAFGGEAILVAKIPSGVVTPGLSTDRIVRAVETAWPRSKVFRHSEVVSGDTYTDLREGRLPAGVLRVELTDEASTWIHIDPQSGQVLSVVDRSRRVYRWLFNGLHSLDIPGIVEHRPLWDIVMIILLLSGFAASVTGVVVGTKRLMKTFSG